MHRAFENIAFGARSESRLFLVNLARELKVRYGSKIHLYCAGSQEVHYYNVMNKDRIFASINDGDVLYKRVFDSITDPDAVFANARDIEDRVGMTINRIAVADRHLGRGYALGGFFHPRSRQSENADYVQMVHAYTRTLEFWEREFQDKSITLCINGTREASYVADMLGIPYRAIALSRYKNLHYWAWNGLYETPMIEAAFSKISNDPDISIDTPYFSHSVNRDRFLKGFSLRALSKNLFLLTLRHAYWHVRRYEKAKTYYYRENVQYNYRKWREYRRLRRLDLRHLRDLAGVRFVYLPLHVEPETALHGMSPEFFYQHSLIAAVSRDLPAGVMLAVKEAYGAIGRRPDNFYRQIADLKNVVLLDPWEVGMQCAQQADVVVTICGTAGIEALAGGRPVITFGRHNFYNFVPSVQLVRDETELVNMLREALNGKFDSDQIKRDARKLLSAILSCSFDMGSYDYVALERFEMESVIAAVDSLASTLDDAAHYLVA